LLNGWLILYRAVVHAENKITFVLPFTKVDKIDSLFIEEQLLLLILPAQAL
jgi:hypothetical protein